MEAQAPCGEERGGWWGLRGNARLREIQRFFSPLPLWSQDGIALTANWVQPVVLGPRPLARGGHVSVVIDGRMHVFGGCLGWGVDSSFDDLWDLLPAEDGAYEWNRVIAPPSTVGNATSSSDNAGAPSSSNTTEAPSWPGQRCWHVGTPHPEGMLISGGRAPFDTISMGSEFDGQEAVRWRSLADVWIFRPEQRLTNGSVSWPAQWVPVPQQIPTSGVSIHRSHHAGVFTRGELLLFGGLWTDVNYVTSYTTYIVRDFLRVPIPSIAELLSPDPSPPTLTVLMSRGPIWVYDHTMVLAGESAQSLANSPIIFGGKGESGSPGINIGMGIFDSVWIYSLEEARWEHINPYGDALAGAASFVSSLLFGTVGFILYTCVIVCVFMRKLVRARRDFQSPSLWMESPEAGAMRPRRAETRGIPQAAIDALPRHKWGELQSAYEAPRGTTVGGAHGAESASAVVDASPGVESPSKASGPGSRTAAAPSKRSNGSVESIELASKGRSEAPAVTIVRAVAVGKEEVATRLAEAAAVECTSADADSVASGDEDAELCSVCLCAYDEDDMLIRLPCAHIFHEACISRWLHQDSSCPQCRHLVSSNTQLASPPSAADWQAAHDARRMAARRRSNDVEAAVVVVPAAAVPVAHSAPMSS